MPQMTQPRHSIASLYKPKDNEMKDNSQELYPSDVNDVTSGLSTADASRYEWQDMIEGAILMDNKLLVHIPPPAETSQGGIVIPEKSREKVHRGTVLEVEASLPQEWIGMTAYWPNYAGQTHYDGKDGTIMTVSKEDIGWLQPAKPEGNNE